MDDGSQSLKILCGRNYFFKILVSLTDARIAAVYMVFLVCA